MLSEWLEKAVEYNDAGVSVAKFFNNIHDDPDWIRFPERVRRSPEQLAAIDMTAREANPSVNAGEPLLYHE